MVLLLRLLVVASEGRFLQRPTGWTNRRNFCVLHLLFRCFLILWPFLMVKLKAESLIERFKVHALIHIFAPVFKHLLYIYIYQIIPVSFDYIWFITSIYCCCLASSLPPSGLCLSSTAETEVWAERWRDFALLAGLEFARFHRIQPTTMKTPQP